MREQRLLGLSVGLFLITATLLTTELLLIRVFDVILTQNLGYVVVTLAMFASGVAGAVATLRPPAPRTVHENLAILACLFAISLVLLRPVLNVTPVIYSQLPAGVLKQLIGFLAIYTALVVPFFASGLILAYVFSAYPERVRRLYCWDLAGAAFGCVAFLPFFRSMGPGALMFWAAAVSMLAAAAFTSSRSRAMLAIAASVSLFSVPLWWEPGDFEFRLHAEKRGARSAQLAGRIEFTEWDPISKIDVIDEDALEPGTNRRIPRPKHIAYDGGSQSSYFSPFDGDYERLRRLVIEGSPALANHFWHRGVLVSHYLKRDRGSDVLIIGSAGGQETTAALLFGGGSVDGVEMVGTVVKLGAGRYAPLIGHIFNDPRVNNQVGEGRTFLRTTSRRYDIVQIFSNHLSSNVASGMGATAPVYLQTVEAYSEYLAHLKTDGVLHINHHFYPRVVTTAARAWKESGRTDFQQHVVVYEMPGFDTLPTILIKASPWTSEELRELAAFFAIPDGDLPRARVVVDPSAPRSSFLSPEFFTGTLPAHLERTVDYRVRPSTDDWPYFNNIQKGFTRTEPDPVRFVNQSMADSLNGRLAAPAGEYTIFAEVGAAGLFFGGIVLLVPLLFSAAGRASWPARGLSLAYFGCLGAGFIVIELTLIHAFMKLIGFPLYTFSTVICTMLLAAGLGSMAAERYGIRPTGTRWAAPFSGILGSGLVLWWLYPEAVSVLLAAPLWSRVAGAVLMIMPLGFFLGMPFPLGILALKAAPKGAVAWAWAMNAFFTVVGGVTAGVVSLFVGFRLTLLIGVALYAVAFLLFHRWRGSIQESERPAAAYERASAATAAQSA